METHDLSTKRLLATILLNLAITIAEFIGGLLSGSLALLSDAGHNLSDVLSLILGYFGEKISVMQPTKKHSFGFKRIEIFTAIINALALWGISIVILIEAFQKINSKDSISIGVMLGVASIGLFGNLFSIIILRKDAEHSLNMKAMYLHLFYDTLSSVAVIVSGIMIYFTKLVLLDTIASFIIAIMIFFSGLDVMKKGVHILMQGVPENIDLEEVYKSIIGIPGVKSAHHIHIWSINSNEIFLSCHLCIDKDLEKDYDKLIQKVNDMLQEAYVINHTTLQIENINICDEGVICCK
jgi:cobalt-zinc-cadmium efflux system protein